MTSTATLTRPVTSPERRATASAVATASVGGIVLCFVTALIAKAAGAPADFAPFTTFWESVILASAVGALGWNLIRRHTRDPHRVLSRLVPAVLAVSFVPDVLVGVTKSLPHTTWGGIAALMVMHIAVATTCVASYLRFLPARSAQA